MVNMTDLYAILTAIGAIIAALTATWLGGRKSAKTDAKLKEATDYRKTIKRMDDAENTIGDSPDLARRWLHERGQPKRPL
jgi:hypothetical protein